MSLIPENPSNGSTFINDTTGVEYTFDGVKWLASGGEELDLSVFEDASVLRDEALNNKIDQESSLNTAAHLKLEDQIQWLDKHWQAGDEKLQKQIDELKEKI